MGDALGLVLPLAVAIAAFPVPVVVALLLVGSPERGHAKGAAFVLAWATGLAAVGAGVLALAAVGGASSGDGDEPAAWVGLVLLALGVAALGLAFTTWRGRPREGDEAMPAWARSIDGFTVGRAGLTGLALSALNPKNALLAVAAGAEIAESGLGGGEQAIVLAGFVVVASLGVLSPVVLTVALGERAAGPLGRARAGLVRHSAAIMAALLLVIGAKLVGDALIALAG